MIRTDSIVGKNPWQHQIYRTRFWVIICLLSITMLALPYFLTYIQTRPGTQLYDPLLSRIPCYNLSIPIFTAMYTLIGVVIFYSWTNSWSFFRFATAYVIMVYMRMITIYFIPLEPPIGVVYLDDPFIDYMYQGTQVTKDLFFSGHTSTVYLIYLVFYYSGVKWFSITVTIAVAIMLLLQHIHYTIDVVGAFFFTYLAYKSSYLIFSDPIDKKWFELKHIKDTSKMFK
jgi:membrane-associated phospholipid phosphatase